MRHTLTLESDVDIALAEACRVSGKSFKDVVNATLRQGLALQKSINQARKLVIEPLNMELMPGVSLVSISALESMIEEESFK